MIYINTGGVMEIPFNYILVNIMIVLKGRKLRTEISKQNLADIIDIITDSLYKNLYSSYSKTPCQHRNSSNTNTTAQAVTAT